MGRSRCRRTPSWRVCAASPKDDAWLSRGAARPGRCSQRCSGTPTGADSILAEAVEQLLPGISSTETHAVAVGERSLDRSSPRDDLRTADALAEEAQRVVGGRELDELSVEHTRVGRCGSEQAQARPVGSRPPPPRRPRRSLTPAPDLRAALACTFRPASSSGTRTSTLRDREAAQTHARGGARNPCGPAGAGRARRGGRRRSIARSARCLEAQDRRGAPG